MRSAGLALALCLGTASAHAVSLTDLWWNPSESGWGLNLVQQDGVVFAAMYVFDRDSTPTWYVASDARFMSGNLDGAPSHWSGTLYQATGSFHGGGFNPGSTRVGRVGLISIRLTSDNSITLSYILDSTAQAVTKTLTRYAFNSIRHNGAFVGATAGTYSAACPSSGYLEEPGLFSVTHSATTLQLTADTLVGRCTYAGPYSQAGQYGAVAGAFTCSNGAAGTFSASSIESGKNGFLADVDVRAGNCTWRGRIGGLRRGAR